MGIYSHTQSIFSWVWNCFLIWEEGLGSFRLSNNWNITYYAIHCLHWKVWIRGKIETAQTRKNSNLQMIRNLQYLHCRLFYPWWSNVCVFCPSVSTKACIFSSLIVPFQIYSDWTPCAVCNYYVYRWLSNLDHTIYSIGVSILSTVDVKLYDNRNVLLFISQKI